MRGACTGWRDTRAGPSLAGRCPRPTGGGVPLVGCPDTGGLNGLWHSPTRAWPRVDDAGAPGRRRLNATPLPASARRPATGPFPPPPRLPAGAGRHRGQGFLRWLVRRPPGGDEKSASGAMPVHCLLPPPAARYDSFGRPSSRLDRNVCDPSGGGSGMSVAWCRRVWMKWRCSVARISRRAPSPPLVGENANFSTLAPAKC